MLTQIGGVKSLFRDQVAKLRNCEIRYLEILEPARIFLVENPFEQWTEEQLDDFLYALEPKYEVTLRSMRLHLGEVAHFWSRARQWLDLPIGQIGTAAFMGCFYLGHESDILSLNFGPSLSQPHKSDWLKLEITYENRMGRGRESFELDRSCLQNFLDDWPRAAGEHTINGNIRPLD